MRKNTFSKQFICILSIVFSIYGCSSQTVKNEVPQISSESVTDYLNFLASDDLKGRKTGTPEISEAADFIQNKLQSAGVKPYFETYRDSFKVGDIDGFNVVGVLEGNDPQLKNEYIIISAHYDHIGTASPVNGDNIANGANDNAAGTVGVLKLAEALAKDPQNKRSIIFALFSAEEMGLKGSAHLAQRLKEEGIDLYTVLNLEMIGVPMKAKSYQAYLTGSEKSNMGEKFNEYTGKEILGFLPQAGQMNLFMRSDNYPFFQQFNIASQTVSTFDFSNYDYYHHVDDEPELMNAAHIANLLEDLYPGIVKMSNTAEKEIKMND